MGPELLAALNDPKTVEIMLNADGKLWQERLGEPMKCIGSMRVAQAQAIIETIAGYHGKEVTRRNRSWKASLPLDGSRFAGQLPPVVPAPTFAIRKKAVAIFTLDAVRRGGVMTAGSAMCLIEAIRAHRNILVIGGTGSGKTTLVNAIINQMVVNDPTERVFIIEDTGEIQCAAANYVQYHTSIDVNMTALLKTTLRMRPDRILVGEVRGPEALDLLMAWNTGHEGGAATLHANNARKPAWIGSQCSSACTPTPPNPSNRSSARRFMWSFTSPASKAAPRSGNPRGFRVRRPATSPKPSEGVTPMQVAFPFRLDRNAVFYLGLLALLALFLLAPQHGLRLRRAPAARCRMKAG
jgi:P-type conjugative transfer ATPase TrbB